MPDVEESRKFWNKNEITIPDDHSEIVGFHNFLQKIRKKDVNPIFHLVMLNFLFLLTKQLASNKLETRMDLGSLTLT